MNRERPNKPPVADLDERDREGSIQISVFHGAVGLKQTASGGSGVRNRMCGLAGIYNSWAEPNRSQRNAV